MIFFCFCVCACVVRFEYCFDKRCKHVTLLDKNIWLSGKGILWYLFKVVCTRALARIVHRVTIFVAQRQIRCVDVCVCSILCSQEPFSTRTAFFSLPGEELIKILHLISLQYICDSSPKAKPRKLNQINYSIFFMRCQRCKSFSLELIHTSFWVCVISISEWTLEVQFSQNYGANRQIVFYFAFAVSPSKANVSKSSVNGTRHQIGCDVVVKWVAAHRALPMNVSLHGAHVSWLVLWGV